jgi:hypothetical protein
VTPPSPVRGLLCSPAVSLYERFLTSFVFAAPLERSNEDEVVQSMNEV